MRYRFTIKFQRNEAKPIKKKSNEAKPIKEITLTQQEERNRRGGSVRLQIAMRGISLSGVEYSSEVKISNHHVLEDRK